MMETKFKTSEGQKQEAKHEWLGQMRVLQKLSPYEFAVDLTVMRSGENRNHWDYRNIKDYYLTFAGTPILIAYIGEKVGDGHNSEEKVDYSTGEKYRSYMGATSERIVGMISEDEKDITLIEQGGHTWIQAKGRIWTVYAPELVDKIVRTGRMEVSAETNVLEEHKEGKTDVFTRWTGLGVTILGDDVQPAIPGANIRALAAMEPEFKEMQLRVASLRKEANKPQKNNENNKGVKTSMTANKTLAKMLAKKFPDFRVVGYSEDGMNVCLLSNSGESFAYSFLDSDKGQVVNERMKAVSLCAEVKFEGEGKNLSVSFDDVLEECTGKIASLSAELETAKKDLEAAQKGLNEAIQRENNSRVKAAKAAAENQLKEINVNRADGEKIDNSLIAEVLTKADNGEFTAICNKDGEWCGDEAAKTMVRDIAMRRQMELDKSKAEAARAAKEKHYSFENGYNGSSDDNSLEGLYNRMMG